MFRRKKEIAIGITILLLGAGMISAAQKQIQDQDFNEIENYQNPIQESGDEEKVCYTFGLRFNHQEICPDIPILEVELTKEESYEMEQKLFEIDKKLEGSSNQKEFDHYLQKKLDILVEYNCLPSFFSLENITGLTYEIASAFGHQGNENSVSQIPPILKKCFPFIGVGPGVFTYVSPLGSTTPFGIFNLTYWRAKGFVGQVNMTLNATGIHITGDSIQERHYKIDGPIWQTLWGSGREEGWLNLTEMHVFAMYMIEIMVGHTISWSMACSALPSPKPKIMAGSFYYFGGPTFPISFTFYKTYPTPWTVMLDIGIIFSLLGQMVLPFWYENFD
ncbi:MAG: hypothetical protein DRN27_09385 [Thermoplasmata archaeon]|nr:MAG: hypothetical protein DRN27_09385 [Thermoplasmata archaeon]